MNQMVRDTSPIQGRRRTLAIGAIIAAIISIVLLIRRLIQGRPYNQRGFTLLEVLIGVAIIALIGIAVTRAIDTNARGIGVLDEKVQGANLATAYLEGIRQLNYDDGSNPYSTVGDSITKPTQYVVNMSFDYSPDGTSWFSSNNSGEYKLQKITILVSRTDGSTAFSLCTLRANR